MPSSALSPVLRAAALFAAGLLATSSAHAVDATLRLQGQLVSSSASVLRLSDDLGSGPGAYLGVEFHINDRFGIEVGASWFELEESDQPEILILTTEIEAAVSVTPITVALNVHLTPGKRYDIYLAPKIGWAFFDELEITNRFDFSNLPFPILPGINLVTDFGDSITTSFDTDDQFVFGLRLGFDTPLGNSSWSFSSSIDYTDMDLEFSLGVPGAGSAGTSPAIGLDPLSIGVGVAYSF